MGCCTSVAAAEPGKHYIIPSDSVPYNGPTFEHRVVELYSTVKSAMLSKYRAGSKSASSDIQSFYPTLQQLYEENYRMLTFFQVPLARNKAGFHRMNYPFRGKF